MPTNLKLPIGMEFFNEFHRDGYYYIDKTEFIQVLLKNRGKVNLFTRPRRFGKTLMMSMLKSFFEIGTDKTLFDGLAITRYPELCEKFMGQYPVISLSLKSVNGNTFEEAFGMLGELIWDLYSNHNELVRSSILQDFEIEQYNRIVNREATMSEVLASLKRLSAMLSKHNNKPVIILIDEYDVPLDKAKKGGYYDQMVNAIRTLLDTALKTNENLMFGVMTGCLRISKESIFTGLNNFEVDTVMDTTYNQYFGFTHAEVEKLLADYNLSFAMPQLTEWYDGYNFGGEKMFCPWDVLNQCKQLVRDPDANPKMYWENTSSNDIIKQFVNVDNVSVRREIEKLIAGQSVNKPYNENITYNDLTNNIDNLYNVMLMTGYLTASDEESNDGSVNLRIPNAEIKDLFIRNVNEWFKEAVPESEKRELLDALWNKDVELFQKRISRTLLTTISYYDYQDDKRRAPVENFYHGFLIGLLVCEGYAVASNKEFGLGREDVLMIDGENRRVLLIEVKYGRPGSAALEKLCYEAIKQIKREDYMKQFKENGYDVIEYGMAFIQKNCMLKLAE